MRREIYNPYIYVCVLHHVIVEIFERFSSEAAGCKLYPPMGPNHTTTAGQKQRQDCLISIEICVPSYCICHMEGTKSA